MNITFFKTVGATRKTEEDFTLQELADRIRTARARTKTQLPWLKLALFGDVFTPQGSLRHDANVLSVTGFEGDYDGEEVSLDRAVELFAGISCMVYTSPSHREDKPRWRVIGFFSEPCTAADRLRHMRKLNATAGGILANESFKLSQAYYYGRVDGSPEVQIRIVEGQYLDLVEGEADNPFTRAQSVGIVDVDDRLSRMRYRAEGDEGVHATQLAVTASLLNAGFAIDDVVQRVVGATRAVAPEGWDWAREERNVRGMCRTWVNRLDAEHQEASAQVIDLATRAARVQHDRWESGLKLKKNRTVEAVHWNLLLFLTNHDSWKGVVGFNEFSKFVTLRKPPPWEDQQRTWSERNWTDVDDLRALSWFQSAGIMASVAMVNGAVLEAANLNLFNPVREYLSGLRWDGVDRLDHWAVRFLGVEDSAYARAVSSRSLIAAVARIYSPGVKADTVLILEGPQGTLKSSSLRTLFSPWFTDDIADLGSKDAAMQILGSWCIELSELDALSRSEVSKIKAFISRQVDRFRPPYGRTVIEVPRSCVFIGTCNVDAYLRDETGNRRYWPLKTGRVDLRGLAAERDQVWAEAVARYRSGAEWWITDSALLATAEEEQASRYVQDSWTDVVAGFLSDREETSVHEVLIFLGVVEDRQDRSKQMRVGTILKTLGWVRFRKQVGTDRIWCYRRRDQS